MKVLVDERVSPAEDIGGWNPPARERVEDIGGWVSHSEDIGGCKRDIGGWVGFPCYILVGGFYRVKILVGARKRE